MRGRGALDPVLAVACFAATLGLLASGGFGTPSPGARDRQGVQVALAGLASLPLWLARRSGLLTAGLVGAATIALLALAYPLDAPFGALATAYRLAALPETARGHTQRRASQALLVALMPGIAAALALRGEDVASLLPELLGWTLALAGAWIAGDRSRLRRAHLTDLQDRLARTHSERERDRRLAVAEERTRIARELHDSAGHAVNVILVQAGAARLLRERDPARSQAAIATIEDVARATIGEIDQLVRALRDPDELDIQAALEEPDRRVPSSVAWAAYRILQEALTNAARHGGGAVQVDVRFRHPVVTLRVVNPLVPDRDDERGHGGLGLIGMRERASLLGGTLHAGPRDGHFHLEALLPYQEPRA